MQGAQSKVNKGLLFQLLGARLAHPPQHQGWAGKCCRSHEAGSKLASNKGKKKTHQASNCTEVIRGTEQIIGEANNAF